jgi:hypothetical protein
MTFSDHVVILARRRKGDLLSLKWLAQNGPMDHFHPQGQNYELAVHFVGVAPIRLLTPVALEK